MQRYNMRHSRNQLGSLFASMERDESGDWVRYADAQAEIEELRNLDDKRLQRIDKLIDREIAARDEVNVLRARAVELERDRERLDWLVDAEAPLAICEWRAGEFVALPVGTHVRNVIDAAMNGGGVEMRSHIATKHHVDLWDAINAFRDAPYMIAKEEAVSRVEDAVNGLIDTALAAAERERDEARVIQERHREQEYEQQNRAERAEYELEETRLDLMWAATKDCHEWGRTVAGQYWLYWYDNGQMKLEYDGTPAGLRDAVRRARKGRRGD